MRKVRTAVDAFGAKRQAPRAQGAEQPVSVIAHPTSATRGMALSGAVALTMMLSLGGILLRDRAWLQPLARQTLLWDHIPHAAGDLSPAPDLGPALVLTAVLALAGYLAAALLVPPPTPWRALLVAMLTPVLGYACAGFIILLAAAFGIITQTFCIVALATTVGLLIGTTAIKRGTPIYHARILRQIVHRTALPVTPLHEGKAGAAMAWGSSGHDGLNARSAMAALRPLFHWHTVAWASIGICIALALFHALLFPITEWDAVIYHAAVAKLWFLFAPGPPLIYGPSEGVQISSNYPPLFVGIGTFYYSVLSSFNDRYLALVSPVLYVVVILGGYYAGRLLADKSTGILSGLLIAVTPLCFMYAVWATSYMLSASLVLLLLISFALYLSSRTPGYLALAGVLLGLLMATTYLSAYLVLFIGLASAVAIVRKSLKPAHLPYLMLPAAVFGLPWYIRNAVLLHDPIYPLGSAVLPSLGLNGDIFPMTQEELKATALNYWLPVSSGLELLWKQISTLVVFDRNLAPFGELLMFPGLVLAIRWKRTIGVVLGSWALFLCLTQLAIGWFWLRTLLLALPAMEVLIAWTVILAIRRAWSQLEPVRGGGGEPHHLLDSGSAFPWRAAPPLITAAALAGTATLSLVPGMALAFTGPNQHTWTTYLDRNADFLFAWKNIGNTQARVNNVDGGDAGAWNWLNAHLGSGRKVATLENRVYRLKDPFSFYYLDGPEGGQLLRLTDPAAIISFLRARKVDYVFVPPWVSTGPVRHPLHEALPLTGLLGSEWFPPAAIFHDPNNAGASVIYAVGGEATPVVSSWIGDSSSPNVFQAGADARLTVYAPVAGYYRLTLTYHDFGYGAVEIRLQDRDEWIPWARFVLLRGSGAVRTSDFFLALPSGLQDLQLEPYASDLAVDRMSLDWLGSDLNSLTAADRAAYARQQGEGRP